MISGGLIGAATVALALTGVEASGKFNFKNISKHLTPGHSSSTTVTHSSGKKFISAKVSCDSDAYASAYSDWKSSYIKAVAHVVKDVCSSKWTGGTAVSVDRMTGFAKAWARATAKTSAQCITSTTGGGKAQGCAYASASAKAFEKAFASAHAEASAEAFAKYCTCSNAEAWSFGKASVFVKLAAEAYAEAESTACASGNQISSASASVDCQAHIFAQTYAFAAARASAAARCYGKSSDAKARTSVDARVNALVYDNSKCVTKTKKKGLSGNKTKANSRTRSRVIHKGRKPHN